MIKTAIWTYFTALLSSRYLVLSTAWYYQLLGIINCLVLSTAWYHQLLGGLFSHCGNGG
ncbi:hypothetical protein [Vibrio sp. MA40-2]|uniref:hypothetical protein n=1 Tax=Vibrio sp. MA40-2 TaxID=3391828 RepID=UPI0039A720D5